MGMVQMGIDESISFKVLGDGVLGDNGLIIAWLVKRRGVPLRRAKERSLGNHGKSMRICTEYRS